MLYLRLILIQAFKILMNSWGKTNIVKMNIDSIYAIPILTSLSYFKQIDQLRTFL